MVGSDIAPISSQGGIRMSLRWSILGLILVAWTSPLASAQDPQSRKSLSPKERAIEYRLDQPISVTLKEVPLEEALKMLSTLSGVRVVPDYNSFQETGRCALAMPVSIAVENVSMRSALNLILGDLDLRWVIEDEVVKVTAADYERDR
jgi:general secretion pathway protein D